MTDALFSAAELGASGRAGYRLDRLEVFNWGTFDRQVWRLTPGGETSLLTGDIGSGKSTLVDALTTLLLPAHKIAYNKAAGAEARERTLRSYVEGHYKSERVESSGRSRAIGLRTGGTTYSVVLGVFVNEGYDETVTLAQVFHQRDRSTPDRFFVTATKALSVEDDFTDFGSDLTDLRKRLRAGGADVFTVFPDYSRSLRRLLGIRSEQALELFHQTVSMKSVSNLNDFVRGHMLEPADSGDRVRAIITHFEDLTKAHEAVTRAREQLSALDPIVATTARYDDAQARRTAHESQREAVRAFVTELRAGLLRAELADLDEQIGARRRDEERVLTRLRDLAVEHERLLTERAGAGGDRVATLEREAVDARRLAQERARRRSAYDEALASALPDAPVVTDEAAFTALSSRVPELLTRHQTASAEVDERRGELAGRLREIAARAAETRAELASLASRTSNLPAAQTELRAELCADLGLAESDLPFAGELLDVADAHREWRGAAERVLRGFALSLLVPQQHYPAVAAWVNGRRLTHRRSDGSRAGSRLVYERVPDRRVPLRREPAGELVLADTLVVRSGRFADFLGDELVRRADFRCVDSLDQLRGERRAVTREGLVRSGDRHEKDDRRAVSDPRGWVLGWTNEEKVASLTDLLVGQQAEHTTATEEQSRLRTEAERLAAATLALTRLTDFTSWTEVDTAEAEEHARAADDERHRLLAGSSTLAEIERRLVESAATTRAVDADKDRLNQQLGRLDDRRTRAQHDLSADEAFLAEQSGDALEAARTSYDELRARLGDAAPRTAADCDPARERLTAELTRSVERLGKEIGGYGTSLVQAMAAVLARWPELGTDLDASVDARSGFVALHQQVATDDLPRYEGEFRRQLTTETIRELAQFNGWLRRQAEEIDARVGRINEALGAIPYNPGRYIRLEKQPTDNQDVQAFRRELRHATDDTVSGDDHYTEERFLDVARIIERFRGREGYADADRAWTRRVTDVRNWFVFSASERDSETDEEWEHYSDSDGKSGGQKEKLAYTILAASLAYQFGLEWGAATSRDFRFAVIDEAFGRGSDVSTRYALELFATLGLQLLIVTPLQKVHVIEPFVQAIGFVDNPTGTASRLQTLTIEDFRERRDGGRP